MCYTLKPIDVLAFYVEKNKERRDISFKELKDLRRNVEKEDNSIYIDITKDEVINTINSYSNIFELHPTKISIIANLDNSVEISFQEKVNNIPHRYRDIIKQFV